MEYLYIFDLVGTFAFSVYGAYIGLQKKFDYVGVSICALLCSMGGGTIREVFLNRTPFYFYDHTYIYVMFAGVLFSSIMYNQFHRINKGMLVLDAIGLSTFAFVGAAKGIEANLGFVGAVFFALLTAVGGGVLRDILVNDTPSTFLQRDFYATPAILSGALHYIFRSSMNDTIAIFSLLALIFALRIIAIFFPYYFTDLISKILRAGIPQKIFAHTKSAEQVRRALLKTSVPQDLTSSRKN
ncbi:MAG: trimeric intracellular cation channel family protein [bacterium]|nr:trimeric intracellular cation channel family protein [bacterium]